MNEDNEDLTNAGPISALQEAACDDGVVCRSVQWQGPGPRIGPPVWIKMKILIFV